MSKKKILESEEAKAVAVTTEEARLLENALSDLQKEIEKATGVEKEKLKENKAYLKTQEILAKRKQEQAKTKFETKFHTTNIDANEITRGVNELDTGKAKSKTVTKFAEGAGKALSIAIDSYAKLATIESEKQYENISAKTDILMADIDALGKKAVMAAELTSKAYTAAINSSLSNLIDGINEGAYAAASNMIDISAQSKINELETQQIDLKNQNTKALRTAQNKTTLENLGAQETQAITNIASEAAKIAGKAANDVSIFGVSTGDAPGAIAEAAATVAEGTAAANTALTEMQGKLYVQGIENSNKLTEAQLSSNIEVQKKWISAGAEVQKAWLKFAQHIEGGLSKSEAAANDIGIGFGYSGKQLENFKKSLLDSQVSVAKWGKSLEDMQKLQNSYGDSTGRNIALSQNDFDSSFALDKLTGEDGLSVQLSSAMDIFNHSVSDSNEMFFEMHKNVSKIGLSGRKYLKELAKNLSIAEKFQFKGGVKGLMEMSKWAQNVRFNMGSLDGMLDKVQTGGLEGIIEQSAKLQVLGGKYAMNSDPLAMAYESYMDPQGFAQRLNGMVAGEGVYNSKTGEADFGIQSQIRMRAMAEATGQDYKDVLNQARRMVRGDRVERNLQGDFNWSDDDKSLITNKAQLVDGEWKVMMDNRTQKSVSDLTPEDLEHLMPEENDEKLVNYVYDIRDMVTKLAGVKQEATAKLERDAYDQWYKEEEERMKNVITDFNTNHEKYLGELNEKMRWATNSQKSFLDIMEQGNSNIDGASAEILKEGQNIATSLANANTLIQNALSKINTMVDGAKQSNNTTDAATLPKYDYTVPQDNTRVAATPREKELRVAAKSGDFCTSVQKGHFGSRSSIMDGVVNANGQSMAVAASKVTPINDGEVAMTSPKDHGVFAQDGGPFDTLFNGVFGKINEVSEVLPKAMKYDTQVKEYPYSSGNKNTNGVINGKIEISPIQININGNSNGTNDIARELSNNPEFIRGLSQILTKEIEKRVQGGRNVDPLLYTM